jgi:transposase-like protein
MQKLLRAHRRLTPGEREQLVEAYRRSSLSRRQFAAQAGISVSALQLWLRQGAAPKAVAPRLIQLPNPLAAATTPARCLFRVRLTSGAVIEVEGGFEPLALALWIKAAGRL